MSEAADSGIGVSPIPRDGREIDFGVDLVESPEDRLAAFVKEPIAYQLERCHVRAVAALVMASVAGGVLVVSYLLGVL